MNSRTVVKDTHLARGCPICLRAIDDDHEEALRFQSALEATLDFDFIPLDFELVPDPA